MKYSRVKLASCVEVLFWLCRSGYLIVLAACIVGCSGPQFLSNESESPSRYIALRAKSFGMHGYIVAGKRFKHVVYSREPLTKAATFKAASPVPARPEQLTTVGEAVAGASHRLHVYIEGDGLAWRSRFQVSDDPTHKSVLMLDLMAMDSTRSLYIGRPCYLGQSDHPGCNSSLWTHRRFSAAVVDSMVAVIRASEARLGATNSNLAASTREVSVAHPADEIVLFGHSGGAALAILIAARLPQVRAVVTVAGNLDTRAWTRHHWYMPLFGSLNPAMQPQLAANIRQLHLLGARDSVIPPKLVKSWIDSQPDARIWKFDTYTHTCCWRQQWPKVLNWVETGESPVQYGVQ